MKISKDTSIDYRIVFRIKKVSLFLSYTYEKIHYSTTPPSLILMMNMRTQILLMKK
jgi:hypothetical protein